MRVNLKITSLNCGTIVTHHRRIMLQNLLTSLNTDVALVQETHLKEQHRVHIKGYRCYRDDGGVGTAIFVKDRYRSHQQHTDLANVDSCAVQLKTGDTKWTFLSLYIPCGSTGPSIRPGLSELNETEKIIIGGDFNARHVSWCTDTNTTGAALKRWLDEQDTNLVLVSPDKPTYNNSKLDHFLVQADDRPPHSRTPLVTQSFADHDAIT